MESTLWLLTLLGVMRFACLLRLVSVNDFVSVIGSVAVAVAAAAAVSVAAAAAASEKQNGPASAGPFVIRIPSRSRCGILFTADEGHRQ